MLPEYPCKKCLFSKLEKDLPSSSGRVLQLYIVNVIM